MPTLQVIADAGNVTDQLLDLTKQAVHYLHEGFQGKPRVNGHGVLNEPRNFRTDLIVAREKIDAALSLFDGTSWPTEEDYRRA